MIPRPRTLSERIARADVPVQMFALLVSAEVGDDVAAAVSAHDSFRHLANYAQHLQEQMLVFGLDCDQRLDMALRDHDDMHRPVWSRMVVGQHILGLPHPDNRSSPAEYLIAVE